MPNTGKPSKDCHLCRSRRVKCDLGRPSCRRCIKYGVECPGYRDHNELIFRDATPHGVKKQKKRDQGKQQQQQQQQQHPTESESSVPSSRAPSLSAHTPPPVLTLLPVVASTTTETTPGQEALLQDHQNDTHAAMMLPTGPAYGPEEEEWEDYAFTLPRAMHEHWTNQSIPILLNVWSTMSFLSRMYSTYPTDGPLVWVAHLFSRTYVTNLWYPTAITNESVIDTQKELGRYMGMTLSAVSSALKDPEGAMRDDVLATVWVLANYELLVGSLGSAQLVNAWHLHVRGMYSMLKLRGLKSFETDVGRASFWSAFNIVQIECMVSTRESPPETAVWLEVVRQTLRPDEHAALTAAIYIRKICNVQTQVLRTLRQADYETALAQYDTWTTDVRKADEDAEAGFKMAADTEFASRDYWHSVYYAAVVKCHHILHLLVNLLTHHPNCPVPAEELRRQREYSLRRVRSAAAGILVRVSEVMTDMIGRRDQSPAALFRSFQLVWPLTSVYIIPTTLPQQKAHAETSLYFIGRELGIKQALRNYPGDSAGRVPTEAQVPRSGFGESEMVQWAGRLR